MTEILKMKNLLRYRKNLSVNDIRNLIQNEEYDGLFVHSMPNLNEIYDLNFLKELKFLKNLRICISGNVDVSALQSLELLEDLTVEVECLEDFDFSKFQKVKHFSFSLFRKKTKVIIPPSTEDLFLQEVQASDFTFLSNIENVKLLRIKSSSIKSMIGLESTTSLTELRLGGVRSLKSITHELPSTIKKLELDSISALEIVDAKNLLNLEELEIVDCAKIETLKNFEMCKKLKRVCFRGKTNIKDGQLDFLRGVLVIEGAGREHYSFKF